MTKQERLAQTLNEQFLLAGWKHSNDGWLAALAEVARLKRGAK